MHVLPKLQGRHVLRGSLFSTALCIASFVLMVQPSWWDEYESGINSSQSSPHRELPVSSSIPESNGTPSSPAASPRRPAANGSSHSEASDTLKAQHKRKATSLSEAIQTVATPGQWASPMQSDSKHPPPRYEHAASLVGHSLYVIGGNCGEPAILCSGAAHVTSSVCN